MDTADRLERIAAALAERGVNFVVIGGWAVEAQLEQRSRDTTRNFGQDADLDLGL